jgi:tetratricopeptide (TPR) repeat protein
VTRNKYSPRIISHRLPHRSVFLNSRGTHLLALFFLFWISLLNFYDPSTGHAQGQASAPVAVSENEKEDGQRIWLAHQEYFKKAAWDKSQGELEKLFQWKLNQGIQNHYYYAIALIRQSEQTAAKDKASAVPYLLYYAEKMAPGYSQVPLAQARWEWSQGSPTSSRGQDILGNLPGIFTQSVRLISHLPQIVKFTFRSAYLSFYNLQEGLTQFANLSLWILVSFLLTLASFSIYLVIRYHSFLAHHLKHLLRLDLNPIVLHILSLLLLLLPFFLGLGWIWLFIFWLFIFWFYGNRLDRAMIIALFIILAALPFGVRFYSSCISSMAGNGIPEILRANYGVWNGEFYKELSDMEQRNPKDTDILQAIALVGKRAGKYAEAEKYLRQWLQLEPNSSPALNNLGNVYLATNRIPQAIDLYKKAMEAEANRPEFHFNLGQAYLMNLLLNEADVEFQRAKDLNFDLVSRYTATLSKNANRMAIDQTVQNSHIWQRAFTDTPERDQIAKGFWMLLGDGFYYQYGNLLVIVLVILLLFLQLGAKKRALIRNCERCGQIICSRCSMSMVLGNQCSQCVNAFSNTTSADPQGIRRKRAEVARYQARKHSIVQGISLILPGFGHILRGQAPEGIVYFFIFSLFLVKIILWQGWVPSSLGTEIPFSASWIILMIILFAIYYGLVQFRMRRIVAQGGKSHFQTK